MAIEGISSKGELRSFIAENLSRSHPIDKPDKLYGRSRELELIEDALYSPCTQVFIVGDRGVGKSSVGIISASEYQSEGTDYIHVECDPETTFESIIANIVYKTLKQSRIYKRTQSQHSSMMAGIKGFLKLSVDDTETLVLQDVEEQIRSVTDAYRIFEWLQDNHSEQPVVMIDEFDRMIANERAKFADLVKHIGDQRNKVKLIFTGIASNVSDLIGQHPSATRQIESITIPRLNFDDRWDIIRKPLNQLGINIGREMLIRIALISDGFPYYIHLLTDKLLNVIYKETDIVHEVTVDHYRKAIENAIETCATDYSEPYNKAVANRDDLYEEVVWSTADTELLIRSTEEMYESYLEVIAQTKSRPVKQEVYGKCLADLTKTDYGSILSRVNKRKSIFTYNEKMLRGYVRLQAESRGIRLYDIGAKKQKTVSAYATSSQYGYNTSKVPEGIRLKNEKRKPKDHESLEE